MAKFRNTKTTRVLKKMLTSDNEAKFWNSKIACSSKTFDRKQKIIQFHNERSGNQFFMVKDVQIIKMLSSAVKLVLT